MKPLNLAPESGSECPACNGGLVETVEFGEARAKEIHAWCGGLDGDRDEGCGWEEVFAFSANL